MISSLLLATLLSAQPPQTAATTARAADPNRQICQTLAETGSRLSRRRVCMTSAQWEEHRQQTKDSLERAQSNGRTRND